MSILFLVTNLSSFGSSLQRDLPLPGNLGGNIAGINRGTNPRQSKDTKKIEVTQAANREHSVRKSSISARHAGPAAQHG